MIIKKLSELNQVANQAVIINYNTKLVTTLALLSAIKYAEMPVLLIDCESTDGSFEHFSTFMETHDFDLISAPLKTHGDTLGWIFKHIPADNVLAIDSDLEILDSDIIKFFKKHISNPQVFGAGFINGPEWLNDPFFKKVGLKGALYHERPWMPIVLLKPQLSKELLNWDFLSMPKG